LIKPGKRNKTIKDLVTVSASLTVSVYINVNGFRYDSDTGHKSSNYEINS
jgi:hypothetical protein